MDNGTKRVLLCRFSLVAANDRLASYDFIIVMKKLSYCFCFVVGTATI